MQLLERRLRKKPSDANATELIELLSSHQQMWSLVRPAVVTALTVHEQLVPELAELIVSYTGGSKAQSAAAGSSAAASAGSS